MGDWANCLRLLKDCKKWGITTIMDIDDYWSPGREHPAYAMIQEHKLGEKITENIRNAEYVTTTTTEFASLIKNYNKNVEIFPNSIDPEKRQFQPKPEESDRLRVGWLGGSSHLADLEILRGNLQKMQGDYSIKDKYQFVLILGDK